MNKCKYCGKKMNQNTTFCSQNCELEYEKSVHKDETKTMIFMAGVAAGFFLLLIGIFVQRATFIGAAVALVGVTVTCLPFATPETIDWLGYRPARLMARILGLLVLAVGVWICL